MKRIYMTAALLGAIVTGASAQVDLVAIPVIDSLYHMPPTGKPFSTTGIFDSNTPGGDSITAAVLYAVAPGSSLLTGDQVFTAGPFSVLGTGGLFGGVYTMSSNVTPTGTQNLVFGIGDISLSDSINTLLNIANFEADSSTFVSLMVTRPNLVIGKTYGWYAYVTPWPSGAYTDTVRSNNFQYTPIIWGGTTSIAELGKPKLTPLSIYPNPTIDNISFELQFTKPNESTVVRVLDIKGSAVSSTSLGSAGSGAKKYSVNVGQLPPGVYSLQVITDYSISVEKFVKK